jgi:hypothetical protein
MHRYARFNTRGEAWKRGVRYLVGIVGLLVLYFGLDIAFAALAADESAPGYVLRYVRYGAATLWATFLAPWVFLKARSGGEGMRHCTRMSRKERKTSVNCRAGLQPVILPGDSVVRL